MCRSPKQLFENENSADPSDIVDMDIGYHRVQGVAYTSSNYVPPEVDFGVIFEWSFGPSGPWTQFGVADFTGVASGEAQRHTAVAEGFFRYARARNKYAINTGTDSAVLNFD